MEEVKYRGTVKFFNTEKGFGFINPVDLDLREKLDGRDLFFHLSAVPSDLRKDWEPREGDEVEFTVTTGRQGLQADKLTLVVTE